MRRWLLIFLVVLMPMQLSWAAVASYCQHESTPSATQAHVGHHEHQHHDDAVPADVHDGKGASALSATGAVDLDCGTCHASCCTPIAPTLSLALATLPAETHSEPALHLSSQPASLPERPNWADLA